MEKKLTFQNFVTHPRFWRHALVWTIAAVGMYFIVSVETTQAMVEEDEVIQEMFFFIFELFVLTYTSFYVYGRFFLKKKYKTFFVLLLLIVVIVSGFDDLFESGKIQMGDLKGFWANLIVLPIFLLITFGIKWAYHGARNLITIERLQAKQFESELNLLKAQVNPHFLFNTLNNIYATNLTNHDKANEIILELADLLRYQLESNKKRKTSLAEEIQSLHNYIALEKIRIKNCDINISENGDFSSSEIVPLLLIPFVENAFKYGTGIENGDIDINYSVSDSGMFNFTCVNKVLQKASHIHSGGIGINNVKKRLELMYPGNYELEIKEENKFFNVNLKLQL